MFQKTGSKIILMALIITVVLMPFNRILQVKTAQASLCEDILNKATCSFFKNLSLGEISIGALTGFYLGVCLPTTQVPVAAVVGGAGAITVIGTGEGPGPGAAAPLITSVCDSIKKALNQAIKQQILQALVNDVTDWIKRGYKGKVVVSDWRDLVANAGQAAVGDLAKEVGLGSLCSPFKFQIQITLATPPKFNTRATCTLDDIVANIQSFYNDFRNGGWIAYQESWQPQNNVFGLALLAVDEAAKREDAAKTAAQNENIAGGGFLSQKNCVTVTLPSGQTTEKCTITSPGSFIGNAAAESLVKTPLGSVIGADELGGYLSIIIDTALNELIKGQINKLRQGF